MKYLIVVKGRVNGHEVDTHFFMKRDKPANEIKKKVKEITSVDLKCMVLEVQARQTQTWVRVACIGDAPWTVGDLAAYGAYPIKVRLSASKHGF